MAAQSCVPHSGRNGGREKGTGQEESSGIREFPVEYPQDPSSHPGPRPKFHHPHRAHWIAVLSMKRFTVKATHFIIKSFL